MGAEDLLVVHPAWSGPIHRQSGLVSQQLKRAEDALRAFGMLWA